MDADRQENMIHAPARGVAGKAVSHTGPVRGIRCTLLNQVPINDIEPLTGTPYSDAIHRHVHHKSNHTQKHAHAHAAEMHVVGGGGGEAGWMERQANEEKSE